jgi:dGTPase
MNKFYSEQDQTRIFKRRYKKNPFLDIRTAFQKDRDRVLHSESFRRLQNKTQVLLPGENDFYRTRLTHSIEVAQMGRSIAYFLNNTQEILKKNNFEINLDLIEAICMAHDIGHPPFGHLGERVLNQIMAGPNNQNPEPYMNEFDSFRNKVREEVTNVNDIGFEGNAQNLRVIENLAYSVGDKGRDGFNPTFAMWEGMLKYLYSASDVQKNLEKNPNTQIKFIYDSTLRSYSEYQKQFFNKPENEYSNYNYHSIENQIMEIADDISYSTIDIEDAVITGYINLDRMDEVRKFIDNFIEKHKLKLPQFEGKRFVDKIEYFLSSKERIRKFKNLLFSMFINSLELIETPTRLSKRFSYNLEFKEKKLYDVIKVLKALTREFVYTTPYILQVRYSYGKYIAKMFQAFYFQNNLLPKDVQKYLPENLNSNRIKFFEKNGLEIWSSARVITDYIASMSDQYFLKLYKKMFND